jgi:hypothetical protein
MELFNSADSFILNKICSGIPEGKIIRILEIGSWLGNGSTRVLADFLESRLLNGCKEVELHCIDTFCGTENWHGSLIAASELKVYENFKKNTSCYDFIHVHIGQSKVKALELPDRYFDLIFIDGNHAYSSIKEDIKISLSKVKTSGIISGHDCEGIFSRLDIDLFADKEIDSLDMPQHFAFKNFHPGVIQAVNEFFPDSAYIFGQVTIKGLLECENRSSIWMAKSNYYPNTVKFISSVGDQNILEVNGNLYSILQSIGDIDLNKLLYFECFNGINLIADNPKDILNIILQINILNKCKS